MTRRERVPGEKTKAPAFQFYAKEFLADAIQAGMSLQETGAYIRLICFEWTEQGKGIPDDVTRISRMIGAPAGATKKMWPTIRACFAPHPDTAGRLIHPRLQVERLKQAAFRRRQTDAANRRWEELNGMPRHVPGMPPAYPAAMPSAYQSACQSDALLSPISDLRSSDQDPKEQDLVHVPREVPRKPPPTTDAPAAMVFDAYRRHWSLAYGHECSLLLKPLEQMTLDRQVAAHPLNELLSALAAYFAEREAFIVKSKHSFNLFLRDPLKYLAVAAVAVSDDGPDWAAIGAAGPSKRSV